MPASSVYPDSAHRRAGGVGEDTESLRRDTSSVIVAPRNGHHVGLTLSTGALTDSDRDLGIGGRDLDDALERLGGFGGRDVA